MPSTSLTHVVTNFLLLLRAHACMMAASPIAELPLRIHIRTISSASIFPFNTHLMLLNHCFLLLLLAWVPLHCIRSSDPLFAYRFTCGRYTPLRPSIRIGTFQTPEIRCCVVVCFTVYFVSLGLAVVWFLFIGNCCGK